MKIFGSLSSWKTSKKNDKIKNYVRAHFTYKRPLSIDSLSARTKGCLFFGYVQWFNLVVPDELKSKLPILLQFKKH